MKRTMMKIMLALSNVMENAAGAFMQKTGRTVYVVLMDEEYHCTIRRAKITGRFSTMVEVEWLDQPGLGITDLQSCHFTHARAEKWIKDVVYRFLEKSWVDGYTRSVSPMEEMPDAHWDIESMAWQPNTTNHEDSEE